MPTTVQRDEAGGSGGDAIELGTHLLVYDSDDSMARVMAEEESVIDAAVTEYLESGGTRDRLLTLTMLDGDTWKVPASTIRNWVISTRAGRARSSAISAAIERERAENGGTPWESPG